MISIFVSDLIMKGRDSKETRFSMLRATHGDFTETKVCSSRDIDNGIISLCLLKVPNLQNRSSRFLKKASGYLNSFAYDI